MDSPPPSSPRTEGDRVRIPEGLLLAILPAAIYALAYAYEGGFISYFGVPASMAVVDPGTLFEDAPRLGALLFLIAAVLYVCTPSQLVLLAPLALSALAAINQIRLGGLVNALAGVTLFVLVWGVYAVIGLSVIYRWDLPWFRNDNQASPRRIGESALGIAVRTLGVSKPGLSMTIATGAVLFVAMAGAKFMGVADASRNEWYLIDSKHPDWVVLRRAGGQMLYGQRDPKQPSRVRAYSIQPAAADGVVLTWQHIGKLRPIHHRR